MTNTIKNNYKALAKQAKSDNLVDTVRYWAKAPEQLAKARGALTRGALLRNRPEELTWLFQSQEARDFGFDIEMDVQPVVGITPLTWAISHRRLELFDTLIALGANPTGTFPETNPWHHLVNEAPINQTPPRELMTRMREVGIPFNSTQSGRSALNLAFSRRPTTRANGRPIVNPVTLNHALDWGKALMDLGFPATTLNSLGQTAHHHFLHWPNNSTDVLDGRQAWLDLLDTYQSLNWDQADDQGQTPRDEVAKFPELQAELRRRELDNTPHTTPITSRPARTRMRG